MKYYRVNQIKLNIGENKGNLPSRIERKLGLKAGALAGCEWEIRRESIDAREKKNIKLVYTVDFETEEAELISVLDRLVSAGKLTAVDRQAEKPFEPNPGCEAMNGRPIIVGFGPCGIFAGLELARAGYRPLIVERGASMEERASDVAKFRTLRVLDPESNMLFGEGGAGTFSDGKLTSGIKDGNIRKVLEIFCGAGAGEDIMYLHRPHIGTDVLRDVIVNLRKQIIDLGGEIRFNTRLDSMNVKSGRIESVEIVTEESRETISTNSVILAIGHSARDTFELIKDEGIKIQPKPFSIGVRMEHPQAMIDQSQYGDEDRLPPADYKVSCHAGNGRGVYSFCMCPGGEVVTCSTAEGELCVNGMSNRQRDSGVANSGILCDVRIEDFGADDELAGVRFQQKYEKLAYENGMKQAQIAGDPVAEFSAPHTTMKDFLDMNNNAMPVIASLPEYASEAIREAVPFFARKIKGYDRPDAIVTAVETRSSSPIRILRGEDGQCNVEGIYPAGEGAGYAGGITSAACDGIRAAQAIIARFAKPE